MCLSMTYTPYVKSLRGQTGNIITFARSEEGDLLSETCDNTESSDKYDDYSTIPPLISEEEIDVMDSGGESDDKPISMEMLEDIHDGSKSHPIINRIDSYYKISDRIKLIQKEWKGELLSMRNMGKGLQKVFKAVLNEILQVFPIFGESGSEVFYFILYPRNFVEVTRFPDDIQKPWIRATLKEIKKI